MDITEQILHLAQTTELTDSEIAEQLGITRQKVTRTKSKHLQSGLGDKVESILEATGIAKAVKFIAGDDCGCDERKQQLNDFGGYRLFRCLTEAQYNYLDGFFTTWAGTESPKYEVLNELTKIRNHCFSLRYTQPNPMCASCVRGIINPLRKLYDDYKQ
jgi:hypothetical protein